MKLQLFWLFTFIILSTNIILLMKVISSSHKPFYVELLHRFYNVIIFLCLYPHLPSSLCPRIINLFLSCLTLSMVEWWADRGKEKKMWAQPICADTQRRSCGRKVSHNREGGEKIVPAKREKERKRREYQERKKKMSSFIMLWPD